MARRSWFVFFINGRTSRYSHSLAIEWTSKADGGAISACGVDPYAHTEHQETVGFMADHKPHCPECTAALEAGESADEQAA